jgi:ApbE superfamily uncharacterized protein (UPF0280 family)
MTRMQVQRLADGRLHLQDGPIDLVIGADGAGAERAYTAATRRFAGVLDELCEELPLLRAETDPAGLPRGDVARRMAWAVRPFAGKVFITPMAAVAGAVADEILAAMCAATQIERAFVNNGGDIAVHLREGRRFRVGLVDRPDHPSLFGHATLEAGDGVGGLATSGWRGRSFSLGIADAVTVMAADAAAADAAATLIANAVDLPDHPAVTRERANALHPESDLGARLVTRHVGHLVPGDVEQALAAGLRCADSLLAEGLILAAALHLQGETRVAGRCLAPLPASGTREVARPRVLHDA